MPNPGGTFQGKGKGDNGIYEYEVESWQRDGGDKQFKMKDDDLQAVGEMTVRISKPDDPGFVAYQTIQLPWEEWEQVEYILSMDWGVEGSRGR